MATQLFQADVEICSEHAAGTYMPDTTLAHMALCDRCNC
jgi:hypothetical protein